MNTSFDRYKKDRYDFRCNLSPSLRNYLSSRSAVYCRSMWVKDIIGIRKFRFRRARQNCSHSRGICETGYVVRSVSKLPHVFERGPRDNRHLQAHSSVGRAHALVHERDRRFTVFTSYGQLIKPKGKRRMALPYVDRNDLEGRFSIFRSRNVHFAITKFHRNDFQTRLSSRGNSFSFVFSSFPIYPSIKQTNK